MRKKLLTLLILFIGLFLVIYIQALINRNKDKYWMTSAQNSTAVTHYESIGFDFIKCTKVEMSLYEAKVAVQKLSLQSMETFPSYEIHPANCPIGWWDVEFPSEADWYALEDDGNFRHLAAFKNGFFYYSKELR